MKRPPTRPPRPDRGSRKGALWHQRKREIRRRDRSISRSLRRTVELAEKAQARGGRISGLVSGFTDIDSLLGGLQPSDLIILAGRPGMGKTSLATNMAFHTARAYVQDMEAGAEVPRGAPVLFFSLEMAAQQLVRPYPVRADRDRDVEDPQRPLLRKRMGEIRPHHAGSFHPAALYRRYRRHLHRPDRGARPAPEARKEYRLRHHRPSAAVSNRRGRPENRVQEITEITKGLEGPGQGTRTCR